MRIILRAIASFWRQDQRKTSNRYRAVRGHSSRNPRSCQTIRALTKASATCRMEFRRRSGAKCSLFDKIAGIGAPVEPKKRLRGAGASSGANWCTLRGRQRLRHSFGRGSQVPM